MNNKPWLDFLQWPLLGGAVFCFVGAFVIIESTDDVDNRAGAAILFVLGSVLVGAWVYALGVSRYSGREDSKPKIRQDEESFESPPETLDEEG